jgi:hypothetical protein
MGGVGGRGFADLEGRSSTEAYTYQPCYPLLSLVYLTLNLKNRHRCMPDMKHNHKKKIYINE